MSEEGEERARGGALLPAGLLGLLMAGLAGPPLPGPRPLDAPATEVSGERAHALLRELAVTPRPAGSAALGRARERVAGELRALGLDVELQRGARDGVQLVNVVARAPGGVGDAPGVLLIAAHLDSVPRGPGAADDGAGVVAAIEAARALVAEERGFPAAVALLLTDGEEVNLSGARLFVEEHPLAERVALVVNLEAVGGRGPARLARTVGDAGLALERYVRAVSRPSSTSVADELFALLPNSTDLAVLADGRAGLDLVLTDGSGAYHAHDDLPRYVDPASLESLSRATIELARDWREDPVAPGTHASGAAPVARLDVLERVVIGWSRRVGVALGVAAALAAATSVGVAVRRGWCRGGAVFCAAVLVPLRVVVVGAAAGGVALGLDRVAQGLLGPGGGAERAGIVGELAVWSAALLGLSVELWRHGGQGSPGRCEARTAGGLLATAVAVPVALWLAPGAAHLLTVPLLFAVPAWAAMRRGRDGFVLLLAVVPALVLLPVYRALVHLAALRLPVAIGVGALLVAAVGGVLGPWLERVAPRGRRWWVRGGVGGGGGGARGGGA